jgi:PEP-CTERM/exosortase A-associated glycosyltransferase
MTTLPLRVLHVLDHSVPLQSGYAFRTRAILCQQRAMGWRTMQLTGPRQGDHDGGKTGPCEQVENLLFHRTPPMRGMVARLPVLRQLATIAAVAARLDQMVRQVRPDVLHAHSPSLNAMAALRVGQRHGIPVVYEVRAFWEDAAVDHGTSRAGGLRYRATRALETYALRRVGAATTICEGLRDEIAARGIAAEVTVIPNAVDVGQFQAAASTEPDAGLAASLGLQGKCVLGFIGSFYAYEGLHLLLQALALMLPTAPRLMLLLVGGGPCDSALRRQAAALGVLEHVVFAGRVPHHAVSQYYGLVDILVYPRLKMRLTDLVTPLKPLEAMAQGRLLVASDVGGHRELIDDGRTGMLFAAGDPQALAAKVLALLAAPQQWQALRNQARRFVETERNWTASVERYRAVYRSVMHGDRREAV